MRLAPYLLALCAIAPLTAQTSTLPPAISSAVNENTGDLKFLLGNVPPNIANRIFLQPTQALTGICSVPLLEAPIAKPGQYASRILTPKDPEPMPVVALPAPPCK